MANYKIIDVNKWIRKSQYEWFNSFSNPTYGFCVKVDVTEIVNYSKKTKTSFFANFLYVIMRVQNEIEAFRLRCLGDKVVLFDQINPDFTIKTEDGCFNNGGFEYTKNHKEFLARCKKLIEANNKHANVDKSYNDASVLNLIYCSCLTTIDIVSMTHPIKNDDRESNSVPRIFWDKYIKINDRYYLTLNMTVSHALMDGEELSKGFNLVRKYALDFEEIINN